MTDSTAAVVEQLQQQIIDAIARGDDDAVADLQDQYRRLGVAESFYFDSDGRLIRVERGDPSVEVWRDGPVIPITTATADTES